MSDILTYSKAMADETRMRLTAVLLAHELAVGEIVQALGLKQSRISRHLKILADSGLLEARRDGQWVFYRAATNHKARQYLDAIAPFIESESALGGDVAAAGRVVDFRATASARFFDTIVHDWERMRTETLGGLDLGEQIKRHMPRVKTAADLGCGTGRLMQVLADRADKLIGVDNAQKMLDEARQFLSQKLQAATRTSLRIGELEHLPLRDGEADFAVMCLALHHLSSPEKGIYEAMRVLAPGGCFVLADFEKHDDERLRTKMGDRHLGFETAQITTWLVDAGFTVIDSASFPLASGLTMQLVEAAKPADVKTIKQSNHLNTLTI